MFNREVYHKITSILPPGLKLITVSKTQTVSSILQAYQEGQRLFGENKAQELRLKIPELPGDIEWHFIGHLQSNKVKDIMAINGIIHSIDRISLLEEVNRLSKKNGKVSDVLIQFHIATEESKYGFSFEEVSNWLKTANPDSYTGVRFRGVMGMATLTEDKRKIRDEFRSLYKYYQLLKSDHFRDMPYFNELSMGMSNDYQIAIDEGSTMLRIGSALFET